MKLVLNREFAMRYGGVALLMVGLSGWFGYDGFVRYPKTDATALFAEAHKGEQPKTAAEAEKFKANAVPRQKQFMVLALIAAALVSRILLKAARFGFEWDDEGFTAGGTRHKWSDVKSVDRSRWEKKGIAKLVLNDGKSITLDSWHHKGVDEALSHLN